MLSTVLLVDDEDDVRQLLAERIASAGYEVAQAEDPDLALKQAQQLRSAGVDFLLVVDLGMPTSGGASFQGGFEVIKRLAKMHLRPATLIMSESPTPAVQARARQMGIRHLVFKPGLSKLDPEQFRADMTAFAARVIEQELPRLTRHPPVVPKAAGERPYDRGERLRPQTRSPASSRSCSGTSRSCGGPRAPTTSPP